MNWSAGAGFFLISLLGALALTRAVTGFLRRREILDLPNERSSHTDPTPRGGGIAVMAVALPLWAVAAVFTQAPAPGAAVVPACALGLAVLSWFDDLHRLGVGFRLAGQAAAAAVALYFAPAGGPYFAGALPPGLDAVAAGILWVWFVNLFNFMDGIDGIAGVETATVSVGLVLVAAMAGLGGATPLHAFVLAGAALGFLWWNWHPAQVFLGDVGSVPLGFLLGWLLLGLAAQGQWAAALILPAYYLADATLTLARRAFRGEPVWRAHKEHFYQRAAQRGWSHARVSRAILAGNVLLVALAVAAAAGWVLAALAGAVFAVAVLLWALGAGGGAKTSAEI